MNNNLAPLSPTETQVLAHFEQGKTYKEICQLLSRRGHPMPLNTLKTHCRRILMKTYTAANLRHAAYLRRRRGGEQSSSINARHSVSLQR